MSYFPQLSGDVTTPLGSRLATLVGTANVESIIRANSLDQMTPPAANVSMNSKRLTTMGAGILATDAPDIAQLASARYPFVVSGCVWTFNSSLSYTMSAGTIEIAGVLLTVATVTRNFTANVDTYVDFQDNGDGTALVQYTTTAHNLDASPALASSGTILNTLRNAIISNGAAGASTNIYQGGVGRVPPSNAGTPLSTTATGALSGGSLPVTALPTNTTGFVTVTHGANGPVSVLQYTGASAGNLTGVTVISGPSTFANTDPVKGVFPVQASDTLGNPINNTTPYPRVISGGGFDINSFSQASVSAAIAVNYGGIYPGVSPFIIPTGTPRAVKISWNPNGLTSSAVAGTRIQYEVWVGNPISGGTLIGRGNFLVPVASDGGGNMITAVSGPLAAGSYTAQLGGNSSASGTYNAGISLLTGGSVWVELA